MISDFERMSTHESVGSYGRHSYQPESSDIGYGYSGYTTTGYPAPYFHPPPSIHVNVPVQQIYAPVEDVQMASLRIVRPGCEVWDHFVREFRSKYYTMMTWDEFRTFVFQTKSYHLIEELPSESDESVQPQWGTYDPYQQGYWVSGNSAQGSTHRGIRANRVFPDPPRFAIIGPIHTGIGWESICLDGNRANRVPPDSIRFGRIGPIRSDPANHDSAINWLPSMPLQFLGVPECFGHLSTSSDSRDISVIFPFTGYFYNSGQQRASSAISAPLGVFLQFSLKQGYICNFSHSIDQRGMRGLRAKGRGSKRPLLREGPRTPKGPREELPPPRRGREGPRPPPPNTPPSFYRSEGGEEEGDRRWGNLRLGVPTGGTPLRLEGGLKRRGTPSGWVATGGGCLRLGGNRRHPPPVEGVKGGSGWSPNRRQPPPVGAPTG
ncbi:hypothetical protein Taro_020665, partial [Colocasia esculenta]|nr:hypothetical protein [Colocasia esculenta]